MELLNVKPQKLLTEFLEEYIKIQDFTIDENNARNIIKKTLNYYRDDTQIEGTFQEQYWDIWYNSLKPGKTVDFSCYNDDYYFTDIWACWVIYSRGYLRSIKKHNSLDIDTSIFEILGDVKNVIDLGCGLGYTTAALTEIFEDATVYGTNLEDTKQWKFCEHQSKKYNFNLITDISKIPSKTQIDFLFASEYFEHIYTPISHIEDIVNKLSPRYLYIANAFNTLSVSHFNKYEVNDTIIDQKNISKIFNETLVKLGYQKQKTKLWNNRPTLWKKID